MTVAQGVPVTAGSIDLDGDGSGDIFAYNQSTGAWFEEFADRAGGFSTQSGAWTTGWSIAAADLNQDGLADFFLYNPGIGVWYNAINNGNGGRLGGRPPQRW